MSCLTCPNCGYDLERVERLTVGDLDILHGGGDLLWKGTKVALTEGERLIVCALARAGGAVVSEAALADVAGYEGDDPVGINAVRFCKIRKAFREVDPAFDALDTGARRGRGAYRHGARWRA